MIQRIPFFSRLIAVLAHHYCCNKSRNYYSIIILLLFSFYSLPAQRRKIKLSPALVEVSGLATLPNGSLWALNDSGNPPELFNISSKNGKTIAVVKLPVTNRDWEDLCSDASGNLWIGDIGNNRNNRKNLRFYRYNVMSGILDSVLFHFPDQTAFPPGSAAEMNFDVEAFIWQKDTLHFFTKSRFNGRHYTKHYTVPAIPGNYTATLRDSLHIPNLVVTGAALSKNGKTLALIGYHIKKRKFFFPRSRASVCLFSGFQGSNFLAGKQKRKQLPKCLVARQFESITAWKDDQWRIANEGVFWQKASLWRIKG